MHLTFCDEVVVTPHFPASRAPAMTSRRCISLLPTLFVQSDHHAIQMGSTRGIARGESQIEHDRVFHEADRGQVFNDVSPASPVPPKNTQVCSKD